MSRPTPSPRTVLVTCTLLAAVLGGCSSPATGTGSVPPSASTAPAPRTTTPTSTSRTTPTPAPTSCRVTLTDRPDGRREFRSRGACGRSEVNDDGFFYTGRGGPRVRIEYQPEVAAVLTLDGRRVRVRAGASAQVGPYTVRAESVTATSAVLEIT